MYKVTPTSACTVQMPSGEFCEAETHADMPFPICGGHAAKIWRHINDMMKVVEPRAEIEGEAFPTSESRQDLVYYLQVGPLVKIGTSKNLSVRLKKYPPYRKLLALEVGGRELEVKRLKQFAGLLAAGNEWFRPDAGMIDHINELRAKQDTEPVLLEV